MKSIIVLSIAAVAAAHLAPRQTDCTATAAIPSCGVPCITSAASAIGCGTVDYACQCTSSAELQSSAQACVLSACGLATGLQVVTAAEAICTACL
ncbi:hypothetical protein VSDG_07681 [Cytospora chrysosperma]|uniref:CFEM domain-containing protein n=1 Tax=Cytospora chrysosperma TaxID=252740 RepID=A0A423VJ74_CYTCH|nr:hypothetical protein VSDG_07681 [Valsa sordida]